MIHRQIEKSLNLSGVQVEAQNAACTRLRDEVRHQPRRHGFAGLDFLVLPRIAVIGQHDRDTQSGSAAERIYHNQQFHQIVVNGRTGRLHDEYVLSSHTFFDFDADFAVGKMFHHDLAQR